MMLVIWYAQNKSLSKVTPSILGLLFVGNTFSFMTLGLFLTSLVQVERTVAVDLSDESLRLRFSIQLYRSFQYGWMVVSNFETSGPVLVMMMSSAYGVVGYIKKLVVWQQDNMIHCVKGCGEIKSYQKRCGSFGWLIPF